ERTWRQKTKGMRTFLSNGWKSSRQPPGDRWRRECATPSSTPTNQCWTTHPTARLTRWRSTGAGARKRCRTGWDMAAFEYRQAQPVYGQVSAQGVSTRSSECAMMAHVPRHREEDGYRLAKMVVA